MTGLDLLWTGIAAGLGSAAVTGWARGYAIRRAVLDIPNERSSHSVPTPSGGGVGLAVVILVGTAVLGMTAILDAALVTALVGGGALIAGVGWLDDHRHVAARWRALAQVLATVWALVWLGGFPQLNLGAVTLHLGGFGFALALVATVWIINLYNFMDGIDGIAGVQSLSTAGTAAALLWLNGAAGEAVLCVLVAGATAGFLLWNWQPARIFMGDVGSYLLGFVFCVLAIRGELRQSLPSLLWLLLLAVFICDATFTLIRRAARGEIWYHAHRSHAYQRLIQLGWSHARVSFAVLAFNLLVVAPLAWAVNASRHWLFAALCAVTVVLFCAWFAILKLHGRRALKPPSMAPS